MSTPIGRRQLRDDHGFEQTGDDAVLFAKRGPVAIVSLNRPEALNAYNLAMRDALLGVLMAVRDDPEIRAMILCGNGSAFSTGGDLTEFGSAPSVVAGRAARWRRDVWGTLWSLPKPTIAAVHGYVVGGGFEMALLCDLCIAAADAQFRFPETGLGMIPGVGGTQTTPRLAGAGRGLDLVLTGRWLSASEAQRCGLVARVVPPKRVKTSALQVAQGLAKRSGDLVAAMKRAVIDGLDLPLPAGLALEQRLARKAARLRPIQTSDSAEMQ